MLKNYFRTAFRNLSRNRSYAFINVAGLAVGVAACLLIFLVIQYEKSFDQFHKNKERIYRVVTRYNGPDGVTYSKGIAFPVGKQLALDFPQLKHVASVMSAQGDQITVVDENSRATESKFKERGLFFIEPAFFEIFNFPFLAGNPSTALSAPNTVVMTQQAAEKYFGDWHKAIGRSVKYQENQICKVTGILKNMPDNTDFPIQVAISFKSDRRDTLVDWVSTYGGLNTFVVLSPEMDANKFDRSLAAFGQKHIPAEYAKRQAPVLQPLATIHFDKRFGNFNYRTFSKELITALGLIGAFLLVIACINFINLATAQAVNRAKEVGVRKVLGSGKRQLIWQFLSESFIITAVAVTIAFVIAFSVLPLLNGLLQTKVSLQFNATIITFTALIVLTVTLLSGLYPAIVMSGFNPITALKNKFTSRTIGGISLRRGLVVLQFTVAQALIIGTLIVVSQMNYFKTASMGFDKEAIVTIPIPNDSISQTKMHTLETQLRQQPGVRNVSFGIFSLSDNGHWGSDFVFDNATRQTNFDADLKWADANVFKTYDLKILAGRAYEPSDTVREFVVNETTVNKLGIRNPQEIIGKKISFWDGQVKGTVVGVVNDFHSHSLAKPMTAVVMSTWKDVYQTMAIKLQSKEAKETLSAIEKLWKTTYPENVYEYQFLDEKIASFYRQEDQISQLYKIFAGIAVFISCLGLYGLVSFMSVQRTKEIGIRKVLGASVINIVYLFSKEFTILIGIAFLIATPLAYFFMNSWLENFSYRISIGLGIFLLTIIASITIAWLTVGYRAIRAATANPVKSLRTE